MTGFGKSETQSSLGRFAIEIQSLNRKYLESSVFLPKDFLFLEIEVKKWVAKFITRGSVSIRIHFFPSDCTADLLPDRSRCLQENA